MRPFVRTAFAVSLFAAAPALARDWRAGGKLLLTGGITNVEGAAGGGLTPWAFIAGNETRDGFGGSAHVTRVRTGDFQLTEYGAAAGIMDRLELSYSRQRFDTRAAGAALGLGRGYTFDQDVFGAKLRLVGDAVYDQDRWLPQIAVGVQYKRANRQAIIHAIGGRHATGADVYVSATKVLLAPGIVMNGTLRWTNANQFGLLGFGGDAHHGRTIQAEGSIGKLITRRLLAGAEFRTKPDNLGFAKEQRALDLFAAWQVHPNVAVTAAYADLGAIATFRRQRGLFLSLQAAF